jgi:hypothetical protein
MKRILVAGCVLAATAFSGGLPCFSTDDFYKIFPDRDPRVKNPDDPAYRKEVDRRFAEYTGPFWCQNCLGYCESKNDIPLGIAVVGIHIGCGYGDIVKKYKFKIIVKQQNPCFVVTNSKYSGVTIKKIDSHTVEIIDKNDAWCDISLYNYGRRGLAYLYEPDEINPKKVHNILGDNLQCLRQSNAETWELYTKQPDGSWKFFAKESFHYQRDHPIFEKLKINP